MPSWTGDGLVMGYSPSADRLDQDTFHLASGGTVDLNGITRLQYTLPPTVQESNYPNRLTIKAPMFFPFSDFEAHPSTMNENGNKRLTVGAIIVKDSQLAPGIVTPTPQQIINAGGWNMANMSWWVSRNRWWSDGISVNETFTIDGWTPEYLSPGTKYWLLVFPAFYNPDNAIPIRPMNNININTQGRAISFWTNRRPNKPTITSPVNNLVVAAGSTVQFTYNSNDPDESGNAERYDRDQAGVQVAYAALPTPDNPNPEWTHVTFRRADTNQIVNATVYMNEADVLVGDGRLAMINDQGFPLQVGGFSSTLPGGHGMIPAGAWQIKVRTADFGHPYPKLPNTASGKEPGDWSMNVVPDTNLSEWSDPVRISVFQQVPAPVPISPVGGAAIAEDQTTRLSWQYRNTFDPPFAQERRSVQIRQAGATDWHTILDQHPSALTYVDLPPGFTLDVPPDPIPPPEMYNSDGTFEAGTVGGWEATSAMEALVAANVTGTAGSGVYQGTRALRLTGSDSILGGFVHNTGDLVNDDHNAFTASVYVRVNNEMLYLQCTAGWVDEANESVGDSVLFFVGDPEGTTTPWPGAAQWISVPFGMIDRPSGAVSIAVTVAAIRVNPGSGDPVEWIRIDNAEIVTEYVPSGLPPFALGATNEYEWRVKTFDADMEESEWSQPARFWIVPGSATGEVKPVPDNTTQGATLGCGTHRVFVYRRGGKERVGELRGLTHVDWSRVRDDKSTSRVVVEDWDVDCGVLLARLQTWAYELVIFRDNGFSVDRVWEGPITLLTYERDRVVVQAQDIMAYAYRRILRQQMNDVGVGSTVVNRAVRVFQNAMAPDDPNMLQYLTPIHNESDAMQYRSTPAFSRTAFEEVDDMAANAGLDYTTVGRSVLLWGTKSRIGTLPEFRDEDLGESPIVSEYGMSMANFYSVSDGNGVHGDASRLDDSGNDPIYGRVEMLSSTWASDSVDDTGTYTQEGIATMIESFEGYAEQSISDRYPPPVVVRVPDNTTLNPSVVLSIQSLVPGVVIPLRSTGTLRTVIQDQKLDSVTVTEEDGKETIKVTMSPFSNDDAAIPEGES
jgi:hypothetical protein